MSDTDEFDPPTVVGYRPSRAPSARGGVAERDRPYPAAAAPEPLAMTVPASQNVRPVASPRLVAAGTDTPSADNLVAAAAPLLTLMARLSAGVPLADVPKLRSEVIGRIHRFDEEAALTGAPAPLVRSARYVLCAVIDEAVMTAPWGHASDWSTNSLLNRFHGETWGGENVFAILDQAKVDPKSNLSLLRLVEAALLLGFEGMHRVREDGRERLDSLREELRHIVNRHLPPPPAELSQDWRGTGMNGTLRTYLPLWIVFAVAGLVLACVYSYQRYHLAMEVAPVVAQMRSLERSPATLGAQP